MESPHWFKSLNQQNSVDYIYTNIMFSEAKQVGETQGEAPAVKAAKGEEVVTLV